VGIISNSDVRRHRGEGDLDERPVREVMGDGIHTVGPDA
jgi:CBS domain-containing protein